MSQVVFEIFDTIDPDYRITTGSLEEAEDYHERGYIVQERRIEQIPVTRKTYITIVISEKWGVEH